MDISVVILTHNEENNIKACLDSVLEQEPAGDNLEVIVVDGRSQDETVNIINKIKTTSQRLKLIINAKEQIAAGRNLGVRASRYPYLAFTDADCVVPKNWLKQLAAAYQKLSSTDHNLAGVGGGNIPFEDKSSFSQALGIYLDSFLGSFNSVQGRNFSKVKEVGSLACLNVLYKKEALVKAGLFDESLGNISEDADMNHRLRENGYKLYFIPKLAVLHKLRPNLAAWLQNMIKYGRGRALFSAKHSNYLNLFFILPLLFALSMILVPFGFFQPLFYLPLLYFPLIFLYAGTTAVKQNKIKLFPVVLAIYISTHFVYSFALLANFFRLKLNARGPYQ